ncbi:MAG: hypothetical protein ACRC8T_07550 [Acidaminococcaceae bacterium]
MIKNTRSRLALFLWILTFFILGTANADAVDYGDQNNWAYHGNVPAAMQAVDVFLSGRPRFLAMLRS